MDDICEDIEIPIWFDSKQKWLTGLTRRTTCDDVIYALLYNNDKSDDVTLNYAIFERWRDVERPLQGRTRIVKIWRSWGVDQQNVKLSMRKIDEVSFSGECSNKSRRRHSRRESRELRDSRVIPCSCARCVKREKVMAASVEDLTDLILIQEKDIQDLYERIYGTDQAIDYHETRLHEARLARNGENYVHDAYNMDKIGHDDSAEYLRNGKHGVENEHKEVKGKTYGNNGYSGKGKRRSSTGKCYSKNAYMDNSSDDSSEECIMNPEKLTTYVQMYENLVKIERRLEEEYGKIRALENDFEAEIKFYECDLVAKNNGVKTKGDNLKRDITRVISEGVSLAVELDDVSRKVHFYETEITTKKDTTEYLLREIVRLDTALKPTDLATVDVQNMNSTKFGSIAHQSELKDSNNNSNSVSLYNRPFSNVFLPQHVEIIDDKKPPKPYKRSNSNNTSNNNNNISNMLQDANYATTNTNSKTYDSTRLNSNSCTPDLNHTDYIEPNHNYVTTVFQSPTSSPQNHVQLTCPYTTNQDTHTIDTTSEPCTVTSAIETTDENCSTDFTIINTEDANNNVATHLSDIDNNDNFIVPQRYSTTTFTTPITVQITPQNSFPPQSSTTIDPISNYSNSVTTFKPATISDHSYSVTTFKPPPKPQISTSQGITPPTFTNSDHDICYVTPPTFTHTDTEHDMCYVTPPTFTNAVSEHDICYVTPPTFTHAVSEHDICYVTPPTFTNADTDHDICYVTVPELTSVYTSPLKVVTLNTEENDSDTGLSSMNSEEAALETLV